MKNEQLLLDQFLLSHPEIALAEIEEYSIQDIAFLIETLAPEQSTTILSGLIPYKSGKVLEKLSRQSAINLIENIPHTLAESMLRICESSLRDQIVSGLSAEKQKYLKSALSFERDQIGAHLEPDVLTIPDKMTVEMALTQVRESHAIVKSHVFVLSDKRKLKGYVEVADLIQNDPDMTVKSIMKKVPRSVFAEMSFKDLLDNWQDSFSDLPVIKSDGVFVGTVSRASLSGLKERKSNYDKSVLKTGNALGELYAIGLTSLLGNADSTPKS